MADSKLAMKISLFFISILTLLPISVFGASSKIRITAVNVTDDGTVTGDTKTAAIDVVQNPDCDGKTDTIDPEDFADSIIRIKIKNSLITTFEARNFYYHVRTGSGRFRSRRLPLVETALVDPGKTTELIGLFLHASGGLKYFTTQSSPIDPNLGFETVTVYIQGVDGRGRRHTLQTRTTLSFANYDRCG